jgi:methylenetetrahydrofolate--tRNA-(uracil-5-)-methyltransferase
MDKLVIIGGGLAGSEAAWQAAQMGITVTLYEMRPQKSTGAHVSADLAELVCSNSLGSNLPDRAAGLLKEELRRLGSLLIWCADQTALPAGGALAVDRLAFSRLVTEKISNHPNITLIRHEVQSIPEGAVIIASGPLTSPALSTVIQSITGTENLYFYDAIAPIVTADSINMNVAFYASRYERGQQNKGDYINCPLEKEQYLEFVQTLRTAKKIPLKEFETEIRSGVTAGHKTFFEGCLPIEVLAERNEMALAFGPMRPTGLRNPHTGKRPYAVVQLRQDNISATLYSLVGFQTNLRFPEQKRVFRMIPGLEQAEFVRYGQMHRNTFLASPVLLKPTLQFNKRENLFFAGQITGVEGYAGNIATGLLAGINAARYLRSLPPLVLPPETMIGALCNYITKASLHDFQPMKANFGILPPLDIVPRDKSERVRLYVQRALENLERFKQETGIALETQ